MTVPIISSVKKAKKLIAVAPVGNQVLISLLTKNELVDTQLFLPESETPVANMQGYVVAIGAKVDQALYGFTVGNRVLVTGGMVVVPKYDDDAHIRVLTIPENVKAVLTENTAE